MGEFTVLPLGVGDAFSARYYSTCLALRAEGTWLLVDCPHPIRKILRESGQAAGFSLDVPDFQAIVLTHLHADHASGLEGFAYMNFYGHRRKTRLLLHPVVAERVWEGHLAAGMETSLADDGITYLRRTLDTYFTLDFLSTEAAVRFGPFAIECRPTKHHVPTFAVRITAAGRRLGYSADTMFDPGLIDWLDDSDLIIHETNEGTHTPYEKLVSLPQRLKDKMRLVHYPDEFDLETSNIAPLRQGVPFTL
jgi:ribonuclease BN (tRNA processing enzyme)